MIMPNTKVRVASLDALRGLVMFLMLAEAMRLWTVQKAFLPGSIGNWFWELIAFHTEHVPWQGCSLHDIIQPAFSFLAGASLPFSIASRRAAGQSFARMLGHAVWRSAALIFLGIFLRSLNSTQTYWTFEDTLTQIGLGYVFLFLLALAPVRIQVAAVIAILAGYWAAFALWPLPPASFDYTKVGVPVNWPHLYNGFLAHWNKNSNLAWSFDVWFLNLFPRQKPFQYNGGGWSTLSFIPTLATMLLGVLTAEWLRTGRTVVEKLRGLILGGVALALLGLIWQWTGLCPIVKRVWTPAYTLYSGGVVVLMLAAFYAAMEWRGWHRWALPLLVIGANSIAIYVMSWTMEKPMTDALLRHLGHTPFAILGAAFEPVLRGFTVILVFWLILYWMYRRKIFLRI
jgi:heparan-alpha-glucosaminide N-acetyltransferase